MALVNDELGQDIVPCCLIIIVEELGPLGVEAVCHVYPTVEFGVSLWPPHADCFTRCRYGKPFLRRKYRYTYSSHI